jgi:dihydropyrimidinase
VETRPEYLLLMFDQNDPDKIKENLMVPPLRFQEDLDELWEGLARNEIQVIATDQFGTHISQKKKNSRIDSWTPGGSSVEILLPLIHHYGVNQKRIEWVQMVRLLSSNPAKIFGLYPKKGSLEPGSDADLVVFDPEREFEIKASRLHSKTGFSPFEGHKIKGWPVMTFLRGELIAENGKFCGAIGSGEFVKSG